MSKFVGFCFSTVLLTPGFARAGDVSGPFGASPESGPAVCQTAVLRNGFVLQFARRETAGTATRLWLCGSAAVGYVDIPTAQIESFAPAPSAIPPPAPAVPASTPASTAGHIAPVKDRLRNLIVNAASRHEIDPDFVASVVKAESGFNPAAVSRKGAQGLMQLMPETAAMLGVENLLDPAANVEGGTKYLRLLLDQYGGDAVKALAAYNAGPQRVEQYGGIPPYPETRAYVTRIIDDYNRKKLQQQAQATAPPASK